MTGVSYLNDFRRRNASGYAEWSFSPHVAFFSSFFFSFHNYVIWKLFELITWQMPQHIHLQFFISLFSFSALIHFSGKFTRAKFARAGVTISVAFLNEQLVTLLILDLNHSHLFICQTFEQVVRQMRQRKSTALNSLRLCFCLRT